MADARIKDLTTEATAPTSDDFLAIDGSDNGTRKLAANSYAPQFAGHGQEGFPVSDGSTTNRALIAQFGTIGDISGLPVTITSEFVMPAANPSSDAYVFQSSDVNNAVPIRAHNLFLRINTLGALDMIQYGADTSNFRRMNFGAGRSSYSGAFVKKCIAFPEGNSSTDPTIHINGENKTSNFTASTLGTASWQSSSLLTTYFLSGYVWPEGRAPNSRIIICTLSDAEAAAYTGGAPLEQAAPWTRFPGSAVEQTSGTLEIGRKYLIKTFQSGDDFTNVGASSNASGEQFVATGTTPTTWSNSSALVAGGPLDKPIYQPALATDDALSRFSRRLLGMSTVSPRHQFRIIGNTATNGNAQILSGPVFEDTDTVIDSVEFDTDGTPTITLGSASGGAQYIASTALSSGLNADKTLATRLAAGTSLWLGSNSTANVRTFVAGKKVTGV